MVGHIIITVGHIHHQTQNGYADTTYCSNVTCQEISMFTMMYIRWDPTNWLTCAGPI